MTYPIYVLCRLLLGTLYPGFQSFKAVRTKNVREYVKWMMYWIVFAIYTGIESFTDIFVSFWFPFYYEIKIVFLMWLLSPVAKGSLGSSIMYRKFVHPILLKKEEEIDKYVTKIGNQGYKTFWKYANEGFNFITHMVMKTAIKGGGGLITHLKRSYSLSDLATLDVSEEDIGNGPRAIQNMQQADEDRHAIRESGGSQKPMGYIRRGPPVYTPGEISSGYSSTSEFLPVVGEVMDTEDYEMYDPRTHRRYTPISRSGSTTSSIASNTPQPPGSHSRRKKEYGHGFYPLNHSASLPRDFSDYRSSWIADDSDFTGGTVTPSYDLDEEEDNWSDTLEEIPSSISDVPTDDDRTPEAHSSLMPTETLLQSASEKIARSTVLALPNTAHSPKRHKAPEPPAPLVVHTPSLQIPIPPRPSSKKDSSPTLSPNSKCPHCTIHTWLPHLPTCPNVKSKAVASAGDKKKA